MMTQQVHQCEFCGDRFQSRPQVKNPRACPKKLCQQKRQRSNELRWRQRNSAQFDSQYHRIRKQARLRVIKEVAKEISQCLWTGARFMGRAVSEGLLEGDLFRFLTLIGIRKINKLWPKPIS